MVDFLIPTWPKGVICVIVFTTIWLEATLSPIVMDKILWRFNKSWSSALSTVDEAIEKAITTDLDDKGQRITIATTLVARLLMAYLGACIIEFGHGLWFA